MKAGSVPECRYLGIALRCVRQAQGITQQHAAQAAGLQPVAYQGIENYGQPMRLDRLYRVMRLFGAPLYVVLPDTTEAVNVDEQVIVQRTREKMRQAGVPVPDAEAGPHVIHFMKDGWEFRQTVNKRLSDTVAHAKRVREVLGLSGIQVARPDHTIRQGVPK